VYGEQREPQDQHLEAEVCDRAEHGRQPAAATEDALGVLHGVRERVNRVRHLGVLGLQSRGIALARGAVSNTAAIAPAAAAAGTNVRSSLSSPANVPVASPTPKMISASALTPVLREPRLNSRSAITSVGIPKR
jgi:hypothetical protein